jgi:hypothetical protein
MFKLIFGKRIIYRLIYIIKLIIFDALFEYEYANFENIFYIL